MPLTVATRTLRLDDALVGAVLTEWASGVMGLAVAREHAVLPDLQPECPAALRAAAIDSLLAAAYAF